VIPLEDASRGCGLASTCCHFPRYLMYSVNSATGVTCSKIAHKTDQSIPTYKAIYRIVRGLPKDLLVLAHEGTKAYAEAFDLIHRREATQKLKQIDIRDAKHRDEMFVTHDWLAGPIPKLRPTYAAVSENYIAKEKRIGDPTRLILVDEADRLKIVCLEQMRAIFDAGGIGLVLIGMPGIDQRLDSTRGEASGCQRSFGVECRDWIEAHGAQRRDVTGGERDGGEHGGYAGEGGEIVGRDTVKQASHEMRNNKRAHQAHTGASGGQSEALA
jgi:hypothetical protein